jgi:hypothetical protein
MESVCINENTTKEINKASNHFGTYTSTLFEFHTKYLNESDNSSDSGSSDKESPQVGQVYIISKNKNSAKNWKNIRSLLCNVVIESE